MQAVWSGRCDPNATASGGIWIAIDVYMVILDIGIFPVIIWRNTICCKSPYKERIKCQMKQEQDLQSNLPLTETTFLILLSLASAPKHGYLIMKDVESLSDQRVILSTGTLYGALKRLLDQEWIERVDSASMNESNREIKEYVLSATGRRILEIETARMRKLSQLGATQLAGGQI